MSEFLLKYDLLDEQAKQEVADFVDFLLERRGRRKQTDPAAYRQKLANISVWPDEDIQAIDEARGYFNQWKPTEW